MAFLRRADQALYRAERALAGVLFLLMALIMFASVTHRVFSREEGRLAVIFGHLLATFGLVLKPETLHGQVSPLLNLTLTFVFARAAFRTTKRDQPLSEARSAGYALIATALLAGLVKLLLVLLPNGLVWGPVVALACMLWVGFLGGSIATHEKRHLALEMGEKIWPARVAPYVRSLAMLVTAVFALFLTALAVLSIRDHHASWLVNHLAGNLLPTEIPKWVVFLIFPYTFTIMTLRFVGLAFGALRGESVHEEKLG
jgi:TRAP-type C4-dicarboxylate transport system permease small subunit